MVIDHLPPLKEEHYARGQVLGNNLNMITLTYAGSVFHMWISLLRIFTNEALAW